MFLWRSKTNPRAEDQRIADLESEIKRIRAEWNDVYDKLMHVADRLNKRGRKLAEQNEVLNDPQAPDLTTQEGIWRLARKNGMT